MTRLAVPAALGLIVLAAFAPALRADFVSWDDDVNVTGNPDYRGLSPSHLRWMFTTAHMGHYQPLAWLTLGLDYTLYGMEPWGYHLTSVLIHAAGTVVLYFVLLALLGGTRTCLAAAAGALFWGIHPLRVESVAWITERRDVLCVFFLLLSVLAYLRMARESGRGGPWKRWWAVSCGFFAMSLLSKSLGIMLPFALVALDACLPRRGTWKKTLAVKLPYLALAAAAGGATLWSMSHLEGAVRPVEGYPLKEVVLNASHAVFFYLCKTLAPLSLYPFYPTAHGTELSRFEYWGSLAGFLVVTAAALALVRRRSWAWWTWFGYVALVFPTLGFFVTARDMAADRYTYVASLPLVALLAAGAARLKAAPLAAASAAVLAVLGVLTFRQAGIWRDSETLWTHTLKHDPRVYPAWYNRGNVRAGKGDLAAALGDYDEAIRLLPGQAQFHCNRGIAKARLGDLEGALEDLDIAVGLAPRNPDYLANRGLARVKLKDLDGAAEDYARALDLAPDNVTALGNRGSLRLKRRDWEGAAQDFTRALSSSASPDPALAERMAVAREAAGLDGALKLRPGDPGLLVDRARILRLLGDREGARADLAVALRLAPEGWGRRAEAEGLLQELRAGD